MHPRSILTRLPIRLKLTLAFTGVMAVVLTAVGLFLYLHFKSGLDASIEQSLQARAGDLANLARQLEPVSTRGTLARRRETFAQILDTGGRVIDTSPQLAGRALLAPAELRRATRLTIVLDRGEESRLLARPIKGLPRRVVVVGVSLEQREKALEKLGTALLIGGPLALLLASLAGYGLASSSLRPVESMRNRAATISGADVSARLPLPRAQDEIHRLGSTLNEMLDRLERAFVREREFVSDASHELRTPLAILKMELELALQEGRSTEELRSALRSAAEESDRLAALAEDLLVVARADQGQLPVRRTPTSVDELLSGVAERFKRRGREADRPIAVEHSHLRVDADPDRVQQAVGNLVDNALRYGKGAVRLSAIARNGAVELHVADDGDGFPAGFLPRAFQRFTRADHARSRGGAGLGLAIVQAIAHAHGGRAGASNLAAGGADVWLSLPRARQPA